MNTLKRWNEYKPSENKEQACMRDMHLKLNMGEHNEKSCQPWNS